MHRQTYADEDSVTCSDARARAHGEGREWWWWWGEGFEAHLRGGEQCRWLEAEEARRSLFHVTWSDQITTSGLS